MFSCSTDAAVSDTGVSMDKWLSRLESSGWLGHIKDVLTCACFVAQCLDQDGGDHKLLSLVHTVQFAYVAYIRGTLVGLNGPCKPI